MKLTITMKEFYLSEAKLEIKHFLEFKDFFSLRMAIRDFWRYLREQ